MENCEILSLKMSCIEALARDFDIFLTALNRDENIALKQLLQRNITNALFKKLVGPLQKSHALFLINRYLRTLNMNRFLAADIDDVIKILKRQGEGILAVEIFEVVGRRYSETILVQLACSLPSTLNSLSLAGGECSDTVLKIVTKSCVNLQELILYSCDEVTDAGIDAAFANSNQSINYRLRKLDLYLTSVTTRGIVSVMNNCPNLTKIIHQNVADALSYVYRRHVENNDSQFRKYNLETLDLDPEELKAAQKMCPNVKCLNIGGIMTQKQINICKDFERLESITFHCLEPVLLSPFFETRGSALHTVSLSGNVNVPVETLIQFCPGIQYLQLDDIKFGRGDGRSFDPARFSLPKLKVLTIGYVNLAVEMRHIDIIFAFAPNVEIFSVYHVSGFSHAFVNTIAAHGFPCLNELQVSFSDIDAQSMRMLINVAPNLKRIKINRSENISRTECENLRLLKSGLRITYGVHYYSANFVNMRFNKD